MYIRRKVFSLLEVEGEERLFSTADINLEDAEERIFSLNEEKLFARRDYEGLDDVQKEVLKRKRSEYAKDLRRSRNEFNLKDTKDLLEKNGWSGVETNETIKGGGAKSTIKVSNTANKLDNYDTLTKRHVGNIRKEQLKSAEEAGKIMRDQVVNDFEGEVTKARENKKYQSAKGNKEAVKPKPEGVKPGKELAKVSKESNSVAKTKVNKEKLSKRLAEWAKNNKKGLAIGALTTAGLGVGAAAYRHYKDNDKKED